MSDAQQMLSRIIAFPSRPGLASVGEVIRALALKQSGGASQTEQFLNDWLKDYPSNEMAKWGMEVLSGNASCHCRDCLDGARPLHPRAGLGLPAALRALPRRGIIFSRRSAHPRDVGLGYWCDSSVLRTRTLGAASQSEARRSRICHAAAHLQLCWAHQSRMTTSTPRKRPGSNMRRQNLAGPVEREPGLS
jgi:hypothetical protein